MPRISCLSSFQTFREFYFEYQYLEKNSCIMQEAKICKDIFSLLSFFFWVFFSSKTVSIHSFGTLLIFVSTTPLPLFIQALSVTYYLWGCHSVEKVPFLWIALALSGEGGLTWLYLTPKTTFLFWILLQMRFTILIVFREYVESLHQNRTSALLYG